MADTKRRIAVDAMGGDHGPSVVVPGAVAGAREQHNDLTLVGVPADIEAALKGVDRKDVDIAIVEATETIGMDEHPAQAVRRKRRNSINLAIQEVAEGRAAGMVSAGNSGAVMAAALMLVGRIPGIERPAIATYVPTAKARSLILDLGAVTDPKPSNMVQFARMGQVYAERVLELSHPTVGLLSNGEEPTKGNQLVQQVYPMLAAAEDINFIGNVEGKDVAMGAVDIVVTDGFTGNVLLKTAEGVITMLTDTLRREFTATLPRKLAALVLRPAFRSMRNSLDYSVIGGAPLLGVNGVVIISHGRSNELAIANAIGVAVRSDDHDLAGGIRERISLSNATPSTPATPESPVAAPGA
ncbi:MAG: phosphate acyltransferase PlsX [Thermomicrobiales bacterium]